MKKYLKPTWHTGTLTRIMSFVFRSFTNHFPNCWLFYLVITSNYWLSTTGSVFKPIIAFYSLLRFIVESWNLQTRRWQCRHETDQNYNRHAHTHSHSEGGVGQGLDGDRLELNDIWRRAFMCFEVLGKAVVDANDIWQLLRSEDPRHCLWLSFSWQITVDIFLWILPTFY